MRVFVVFQLKLVDYRF